MTDKNQSVRNYYGEKCYVESYDDVRFGNAGGRFVDAWEKEIITSLLAEHPKDQPILEVAAGTGRFSLMLARMGYNVVALDGSAEMLSLIQQSAKLEGLNIRCVHGNAFDLPFKNGEFKTVFSIRFVWHFANYAGVIQELARVSHCTVVFDQMNRISLASLTAPIANRFIYRDLFTQTTSKQEIGALVSSLGMRADKWVPAFFWPYIFYRRLPVLTPLLSILDRMIIRWLGAGSVFFCRAIKES
jgi:ubiquinone/menaquinone biosynthesis C-methylase UbiE